MRILFVIALVFMAIPTHANDVRAINAAAKNQYSVPTTSQTARDLVQWYKLNMAEETSFREAKQFITQHPNWPNKTTIQKKMEESIPSSIPNNEIIGWFSQHPPLTTRGMMAYINALLAQNRAADAMQTLKNWWPKAVITPNDQDLIIQRYGQYLGSQDHERRLRFIIHDQHYTASRALAQKLGNGYPQLVEAKIALIEEKPNASNLVHAVPTALKNNEALMLARIQWRRKNDIDNGAIELLNRAPTYNRLSNPKDWWRERHIMTRRLMEQGKWASAYQLASDHRQKDGFSYAQAEFVSGWIALRKIGKPWNAFKHFENLFNAVKSPISRSRGAYWAGLASDTLGHPDIATQWYQVAAKYQTTFYGQVAAQRIQLPLGLLNETPLQITPAARQEFRYNDLISAALLLNQARHSQNSKLFLLAYAENKNTGLDYRLSAELAKSLGYHDTAVRIAKMAERDGYIMPSFLFPILPQAKTSRYAIHPAFNHAIMRQESLFNQQAQSHVGALGLMQLMPATARETAKNAGLRYSQARLTSDPAYNMTLGSLYLKKMLDRFNGNRTLAIAAYNAGPNRVARWIEEFGDPRSPNIDEIDWIEGIPVYETRNYVQRVTEALNVYAQTIK